MLVELYEKVIVLVNLCGFKLFSLFEQVVYIHGIIGCVFIFFFDSLLKSWRPSNLLVVKNGCAHILRPWWEPSHWIVYRKPRHCFSWCSCIAKVSYNLPAWLNQVFSINLFDYNVLIFIIPFLLLIPLMCIILRNLDLFSWQVVIKVSA